MEARRLLSGTRRDFLRLLGGGASLVALGESGCGGERASSLEARDQRTDAGRAVPGRRDGAAEPGERATTASPGRRMEQIGLQLYTIRALLAADLERTLARVAAIGYTEVETAGYHGRSPEAFTATLQRHGLRAPAAHVEYTTDDAAWSRTLDHAARAGHAWVVVPWLPDTARGARAAWHGTAERLNRMGDAARTHGLRLAYHNHDFEFVTVDGAVPYELLLAGTDPALVAFELDVYWMTKAGHDPVAWLERHARRFVMTHLKDSAGAPTHRMVDVGSGTIDFARVLAASARAGVAHHFVEHDDPADALQSIAASYRWLQGLTY